jgi:hypothetical protein
MNKKRLLTLMGGTKKPWYLAAGVTPIAAYQAIGASSYAESLVNLANPGTYNLTEEGAGAITWAAATGWKGDGTNYFNTGISPANQNYTYLIRFTGYNTDNHTKYTFGFYNSVGGLSTARFLNYPYDNFVRYNNAGTLQAAPSITNGVICIAGSKAYRNGVVETGTMTNWTVATTYPIFILASNNEGTASGVYVGGVQAFVIFNSVLTPTQVATLSTKMSNLT